jgi:hypothetical protein
MTMNRDKWLAAIIAGVVMGIPSALPLFGNCCILPAAFLAGLIAVFFYTRRSTDPMQSVDGVVLGAVAGLIGGLLCAAESFLFTSGTNQLGRYDLPFKPTASYELYSVLSALMMGAIWLCVFLVPSIVGGLVGAQFFRKPTSNSTPPSPQPPQNQ